MSYPEQQIIVSALTLAMLKKLSRLYGCCTYGEVVEMLALEQVLREALDSDAAAFPVSDEA